MDKEQTSARPVQEQSFPPSLLLPHVAARLFDTPLAIEPRKLDTIVAILSPRFGLVGIEAETPTDMQPRKRKPYQVANGTAIIPVMGTLVQRSSGLDALSGLTSYTQLSAEFDQALNDPDVRQILLHIDSPGGEAAGLFDLTDQIAAARGQKSIVALADGMAASAAYAIGAAAEKIYVTQGSIVGSIGVRMKHIDESAANEAAGYVVTDIYAGSHKVDGSPDAPLTDSARAALQQIVNDSYDLFTSKVAVYRKIPQSLVKATEANVYVGNKAPNGLIDDVRTLSQILGAEPATEEVGMEQQISTVAALTSAYPDFVKQIQAEARAEGKAEGRKESTEADCKAAVTAEQERTKEILGLAGYTLPRLVEDALFVNGGLSGDKFARMALEKKYEKTQANASAWLQDGTEPAKVSPLPTAGPTDISAEQARINKLLGVSPETFLKYSNANPDQSAA
jgi:signal peptide peptidase SppA